MAVNLIRTYLAEGLEKLHLKLDDDKTDKVLSYFRILVDKNEKLNLISAKQDLKTRVIVHLVDSLSILLWKDCPSQAEAMDLGSGGGLPAIPLGIVFPGWNYTLVESTGKKTVFLNKVKKTLNLNNLSIVNKFLEPGKNIENICYDLLTVRAVAGLSKLIDILGPRLNSGGYLVAFKGPQVDDEIKEAVRLLNKYNLSLDDEIDFVLPDINAQRRIVIFKKQ